MTPQIATTTFSTEMVNLPVGYTPADGFQVDMYKDGAVLETKFVASSAGHATFNLTEPGTYYSVVIKAATDGTSLGAASSTEFVLDEDTVPAQVEIPSSVNVGVVPAVATPKSVKNVIAPKRR